MNPLKRTAPLIALATITLVVASAPAALVGQEEDGESPKPFLVARDPQTGEKQWRRVGSESGVWQVIGEANGAVYVHETECRRGVGGAASFVARDTRTGKVKWREPVQDLGPTAFSIGGGTVVILDREGVLRGLNPETGQVAWEEVLPTGLVPVAGTDELILLVQERFDRPRELRGVDRETGAITWTNSSSRYLPASYIDITVVRPDTAIVESGGPQGGQASIDLRTGRELWEKPIDRVSLGADDDWRLLFASFVDGQLGPLHAYGPRTRDERWVAPLVVSEISAVTHALVVTAVYGPPNRYVALDAASGTVEWERDSPGGGSIQASGHGVLIEAPETGAAGDVFALDAGTGDTVWTTADPEGGLKRWVVGRNVYISGGCLAANPG